MMAISNEQSYDSYYTLAVNLHRIFNMNMRNRRETCDKYYCSDLAQFEFNSSNLCLDHMKEALEHAASTLPNA